MGSGLPRDKTVSQRELLALAPIQSVSNSRGEQVTAERLDLTRRHRSRDDFTHDVEQHRDRAAVRLEVHDLQTALGAEPPELMAREAVVVDRLLVKPVQEGRAQDQLAARSQDP